MDELIAGYWDQPAFAQRADLIKINEMRDALGLPPFNAKLKVEEKTARENVRKTDKHEKARAIYATYLQKKKDLEPQVEYAQRVVVATNSVGMTPVEPLATMGCNGGPLICDVCSKPIILEGGNFHGVYADAAWKRNPISGWKSYIKGGVVFEVQCNGTLRVYHGYSYGSPKDCCNVASKQQEEAERGYDRSTLLSHCKMITEFVREELPNLPLHETVNDILNTVFGYDPGLGVNKV